MSRESTGDRRTEAEEECALTAGSEADQTGRTQRGHDRSADGDHPTTRSGKTGAGRPATKPRAGAENRGFPHAIGACVDRIQTE